MTFRAAWGKCSDDGYHHLAHHCADVAACFEALMAVSTLRARLEGAANQKLTAVGLARLAVLAFLHDCGKLHPGFQAKGWPPELWRNPKHGHVCEGATIFLEKCEPQIAKNLHFEQLLDWGVNCHHLFAVLSHHGRPLVPDVESRNRWDAVASARYDPVQASAEIGSMVPRWFPKAFEADQSKLPETPAFTHYLCGLVSLADWLGSTCPPFKFVPALDPAYMDQARIKAEQAMIKVGLDPSRWRAALSDRVGFQALAPDKTPRPAQAVVGGWPVDDPLMILEAETGSGKTEAALWRFAQLFAAGKVDSLYFALPTRAAAKQIHDRVNKALDHLFSADGPEAVLAVPGYLRSGAAHGQALPGFEVRWDDDDGRGEVDRLARWAAESANRYLAATVAVGTVDQAMLAGLQVKHAHLRAAALSRALLVIDEVHASDRYMAAVQGNLLDQHLARGGHAMLMSATLAAEMRTRWLSQKKTTTPDFAEALAAPYPAVWGKHAAGPQDTGADSTRSKAVAMTLIPFWDPNTVATQAISAAQGGPGNRPRVLVIRNTVTEALATFKAIRAAGEEALLWHVTGGPALHHARFAVKDRELLDRAVEKALSPRSRATGGGIVIGTQTLEQSLDIDADILITDLCPVDVLLQRIGRLHRHALPRPAGFEQPHCVVMAPEGGLSALVKPAFENGLGIFTKSGGGIYRNLHAVELTRRLIQEHPIWEIPAMNRFLVESATHPERIEALNTELGEDWSNYWHKTYGSDLADSSAAHRVMLHVDVAFADASFASDEADIRTRLGAEGARVQFDGAVMGPFGQEISELTLPGHWCHALNTADPVRPKTDGKDLVFQIGTHTFRYGRMGLLQEKP